jgi:hypothetical protein
MRQITDRMSVGELNLEMELQSLRTRVSALEARIAELSSCSCSNPH